MIPRVDGQEHSRVEKAETDGGDGDNDSFPKMEGNTIRIKQ